MGPPLRVEIHDMFMIKYSPSSPSRRDVAQALLWSPIG